MNVDYYSVLMKAVAGKDAAARDQIYKDAYSLITRSVAREAAASHVAALEDAIRLIENNLEEEARSAAVASEVLSTGGGRTLLIAGVLAVVAVVAVAAVLYGYMRPKDSPAVSKATHEQEVAMPDLKPGVDGGSTGAGLPFALQRQVVFYRTTVVPGSIVIDRESRYLYLIESNNSARRYGIGIARECLGGGNLYRVANKLEWPDWKSSSPNANSADALLAAAGRPGSVLGARALLLDKPGLLIHGTNSPNTIGHLVATGCIRLVNDDVEDLYRRVSLQTRVVFVS